MGFKFEKADAQEMKRLEIEVHFRTVPTKDSPPQYHTVCDVLDRWSKKHVLSSDHLGSREEAFKNALEKVQKMNRVIGTREESSAEVEKMKKLVEEQAKRIEQLERSGKKQTTGAA